VIHRMIDEQLRSIRIILACPAGICVVCAQFHHCGNEQEHCTIELSRNLETRDRSVISHWNRNE